MGPSRLPPSMLLPSFPLSLSLTPCSSSFPYFVHGLLVSFSNLPLYSVLMCLFSHPLYSPWSIAYMPMAANVDRLLNYLSLVLTLVWSPYLIHCLLDTVACSLAHRAEEMKFITHTPLLFCVSEDDTVAHQVAQVRIPRDSSKTLSSQSPSVPGQSSWSVCSNS